MSLTLLVAEVSLRQPYEPVLQDSQSNGNATWMSVMTIGVLTKSINTFPQLPPTTLHLEDHYSSLNFLLRSFRFFRILFFFLCSDIFKNLSFCYAWCSGEAADSPGGASMVSHTVIPTPDSQSASSPSDSGSAPSPLQVTNFQKKRNLKPIKMKND